MKHDPRLNRAHYEAELFRLRAERFLLAGAVLMGALIVVGLTSLAAHGLAVLAQLSIR